ncbi:MAG TPA: hypothetical protein VGW74_03220 [Propionibacteriaceae bacterium]|nr:hypothetical protein [Propionibacteriaceae bacterium]
MPADLAWTLASIATAASPPPSSVDPAMTAATGRAELDISDTRSKTCSGSMPTIS